MEKEKVRIKEKLNANNFIDLLRTNFATIKDNRDDNKSINLTDILMSAYAMFSLKLPYSLHEITNLVANFELSEGAIAYINDLKQENGVTENDFTNSLQYTIYAANGFNSSIWTVSVNKVVLNTETDFISFSFAEQFTEAQINNDLKTIKIEVKNQTNLTNLVSNFELSSGATAYVNDVLQQSETTTNDFTNPIVYSINAENGFDTQNWTVTVTVSTVGINNLNNNINIYPNPAVDFIYIDKQDIKSISIIDICGKVFDLQFDKNSKISVNHLKSGTYILKIEDDSGTYFYRKIVINH